MSLDSLIKKALAKQEMIKPSRTKKRNAQPEAVEQEKVIKWARDNEKNYPFLWMLHSSLNGVRLSKMQAGKAKASGMLSGVPDLFLPVPRGCFFGLYIEMKSAKGRISSEQSKFLQAASDFGYSCFICYSAVEAIKRIEDYYQWIT
jgi:hypothetical protein